MRLIEQKNTSRGFVQESFALSRALTWSEQLCLTESLATNPSVDAFFLQASCGEIGGGGYVVDEREELASFVKQAQSLDSGDLEGRLIIGKQRVSFFLWGKTNVTFVHRPELNVSLSALLEAAEQDVLG